MVKNKTEADLESTVVELVEDLYKGEALKLRIDGRNGYPDRTILLPGQPAFTVELKTPTGSPSDGQLFWHKRLFDLGKKSYIVDNIDVMDAILICHAGGEPPPKHSLLYNKCIAAFL